MVGIGVLREGMRDGELAASGVERDEFCGKRWIAGEETEIEEVGMELLSLREGFEGGCTDEEGGY